MTLTEVPTYILQCYSAAYYTCITLFLTGVFVAPEDQSGLVHTEKNDRNEKIAEYYTVLHQPPH